MSIKTSSGPRERRNVMVVGGAGYIGSFTVKNLVDRGDDVTVFDNLSVGHQAAVHRTKARLVIGDLENRNDIEKALSEKKFDAVVHFAAHTSVPESVAKPQKYYDNNVRNTINLVDAMVNTGVKKLVFSSTAATYGNPQGPLNEEHPQNPINPYGRTKLIVESMLKDLASAGELSSVALRYFNACGASRDGEIGEDHNPETHLMRLVMQAALGQRPELKLFGEDYDTADGTCVRDYIHVEDLASAHLQALDSLSELKVPSFRGFNVGTGQGTSNLQIIRAVEEVTGRKVPYTVAPRRAGDPAVLVADSGKIQRELGWKPRYTDLKEIVETVYAWCSKYPNGYPSEG